MTENQINRKEMQETVSSFLDENAEVWNTIPKITEFKTQLDDLNTAIDTSAQAQLDAQVYLGKSKSQLKRVIAQKSDMLNDAIEAYAGVEGDSALEQKMADSYTDLYRLRNTDFGIKIQEIVKEGNGRVTELAPYGVSADQITDLKADIDNFLVMNGKPRLYSVQMTQATEDLSTLFKQVADLLELRLDKVMKMFKRRNANFYNGYVASRSIIG